VFAPPAVWRRSTASPAATASAQRPISSLPPGSRGAIVDQHARSLRAGKGGGAPAAPTPGGWRRQTIQRTAGPLPLSGSGLHGPSESTAWAPHPDPSAMARQGHGPPPGSRPGNGRPAKRQRNLLLPAPIATSLPGGGDSAKHKRLPRAGKSPGPIHTIRHRARPALPLPQNACSFFAFPAQRDPTAKAMPARGATALHSLPRLQVVLSGWAASGLELHAGVEKVCRQL